MHCFTEAWLVLPSVLLGSVSWGVAFKCESHRQLNVFLLFKRREITK